MNIDSNIFALRKNLNELNKIKKPRPDTDKMDREDVLELIRNGTLELEEFLKAGNDTVVTEEKTEDSNKQD